MLPRARTGIRFDRNELAGAFGDLGTFPLLIGMTLAAGLDGTSVLLMFGLMQLLTGLIYRMPMPVQPLKVMAAIVIAQQASAATLYGAGLAIGLLMLVLAASGLLQWLARVVPRCVVRGLQFDGQNPSCRRWLAQHCTLPAICAATTERGPPDRLKTCT